MKKSILVSFALFFTAFFAVNSTAIAGDAAAGKEKSAVCGGCHGPDGNSFVPTFPKLAGQNETYFIKQIKDFKANTTRQNEIMLGQVAALSEQDAADIGAYFQSNRVTQVATFDKAKADAGAALYKGGDLQKGIPACASCHGPTGAGVAGIGYPHIGGQYSEYTLAQLMAFKNGTRTNDDKKIMQDIVKQLSDAEIDAVANYIASIK